MKTKKKKKSKNTVKQRNRYTLEHKAKARKYYLSGLNLHEVSKLMDNIPVRTLESWQQREKWNSLKKPPDVKIKAKELKDSGKTYAEIANILQISRVTVWRYIVAAEQQKKA